MTTNTSRWRIAGAMLLASAMLAGPASQASAQSSDMRTITVPFASATTSDGYVTASMGVTYALIACQGEIHIAYSLNEGSATAGSSYRLGGKTYPASGAPPQPSSIHFAGTVYRGPATVGSFADGLAGKSIGMGCYSGQTQKIANIASVIGPNPTAAQVTAYLASLSAQVRPGEVLRSAAQESLIRGELRRAEAEAAAAARKAEQEAQAKARQEAEQRAAADRQAESQRTANASSQASVASTSSTSSGGGYVPSGSHQAPAPPPTREQRIADAIASDHVLADQRLVEQRAKLAQQQAAMANAQQQQNAAMIAAAPAALELAGSIYGALDAWDRGIKNRAYQKAQLNLVGKCKLANGMDAPKDGDIRLGVEFTAKLSKADCGENAGNRYKAFMLELPETTNLQFTIRPASWHKFTSFQIDVRDLDNKQHMFMGWQEWGAIQRTNSKNVVLPAGLYVVSVFNGVEDIFLSFDMRVDAMSADWKSTVVPPWSVPVASAAAAPVVTSTNAPAATIVAPTAAKPSPVAAKGSTRSPGPAVGQTADIARNWGVLADMVERDFHFGDLLGTRCLIAFRWEDPGRQMSRVDASPLVYRKTLMTLDPATGEIVYSQVGYEDVKYQIRLTVAADGSVHWPEGKHPYLSRSEDGRLKEGKAMILVPTTPDTPASQRGAKLIAAGKLRAANPGLREAEPPAAN